MKKFLKKLSQTATIGLCTAGLAFSASAATKIRISSPAVPEDWHARMWDVFKAELEKEMPGHFDVEVHLNSTLFKQEAELTALQRGNLDVALLSAQQYSKQLPDWTVFTAGYLIRSPGHQKNVFDGEIGKEFFKLTEDKMKIHPVAVLYLGTRQLNLRADQKITTPSDLNGIKLRMPGSDAWQFLGRALGASPTPMAFSEVYTGLQTGAIDGQDNPLSTDRAAKFYEVTKQIVLTDHLVDGIFITFSGRKWDKYNDEEKSALEKASFAARDYNNENRIKEEAELVAFFKEQGLDVYKPDQQAFRDTVQKAYLESDFSKDWPEGIVDRVNAIAD
ncbi:MAG: sialic acid TRAP transporter substrate-binding protein SiaP [Alphaproteobacteria bacterium]